MKFYLKQVVKNGKDVIFFVLPCCLIFKQTDLKQKKTQFTGNNKLQYQQKHSYAKIADKETLVDQSSNDEYPCCWGK